jgi:hypothetical protein
MKIEIAFINNDIRQALDAIGKATDAKIEVQEIIMVLVDNENVGRVVRDMLKITGYVVPDNEPAPVWSPKHDPFAPQEDKAITEETQQDQGQNDRKKK